MPYPVPTNELKRLEALRRFRILDTAPEAGLDDFVAIAAGIFGVPISLVSLLDTDRQWFKARIGLGVCETPRDQAFCSYTILANTVMVVEDAQKDPRFADNPLVTGEPHIRFYAGAPLIDREGHGLGSLCVIDRKPHRFSKKKRAMLAALARRTMAEIEGRLLVEELASALEEVKLLSGLLPICAHCKSIREDSGYWSSLEGYVMSRTDAKFSHGICPGCLEQEHPEIFAIMKAAGKV